MIVARHLVTVPVHPLPRWLRTLLLAGPGIFCVGYTIGTGAVTKLTAAGAQAGMQLLWVLPIGGLLFWALLEACGRYTVVTGGTVLHDFRTRLRGGRWWALIILAGVALGQWTGLPVLAGLVAELIYDGLRLWVPSAPIRNPEAVWGIAAVLLAGVYGLLRTGRYSLVEKTMAVIVALMMAGFTGAMLMAPPAPGMFVRGLIPSLPSGHADALPVLALIGTSVAAPTFLVRSLLMKAKGWGGGNLPEQRRDAGIATLVIFLLGLSVMACAAGALGQPGPAIRDVFGAIHGLEHYPGRTAAGLFLLGAVTAGLSSIIPMVMILPLLLADYRSGDLQLHTRQFRLWTGLACVVGLAGPVLGDQLWPVHRTASQLAQVFVLPLAVGGIFLLLNRGDLMGGHKAGFWLNAGLFAALGFSLVLSWLGLAAMGRRFA